MHLAEALDTGETSYGWRIPLPPDFSPSWVRLAQASKVPICTGENLARRQGFKDFILNQGCDVVQLDLRNAGGCSSRRRYPAWRSCSIFPWRRTIQGARSIPWLPCSGPLRCAISWPPERSRAPQLDGRCDCARRRRWSRRATSPCRGARSGRGIESGCGEGQPRGRREILGLTPRSRDALHRAFRRLHRVALASVSARMAGAGAASLAGRATLAMFSRRAIPRRPSFPIGSCCWARPCWRSGSRRICCGPAIATPGCSTIGSQGRAQLAAGASACRTRASWRCGCWKARS